MISKLVVQNLIFNFQEEGMLLTRKEKRKKIWILIKKISDYYGGDEVVWLKEYCKDVIEQWKNDLDKAIECFESVHKLINWGRKGYG